MKLYSKICPPSISKTKQNKKTPQPTGADCFLGECYQNVQGILNSYLIHIIPENRDHVKSTSLLEAKAMLIPKPEKKHRENYRSNSLVNMGERILSHIIAY